MVLIHLIAFPTIAILGVILAFQRRFLMGILAVAYAGFLFLPGALTNVSHKLRDIDAQMIVDDTVIVIRARGPISFSSLARSNPYGPRLHYFRTEVETSAGAKEVGFRISGLKSETYKRPTDCVETLGPDGLIEISQPEGRPRCGASSLGRVWISPEGDGPTTRIGCTERGAAPVTTCSMIIYYVPYEAKVSMWSTKLDEWRMVRNQVVRIIDQSFQILDEN